MAKKSAVAKQTEKRGKKICILDTNILVHDPTAFFAFPHTMIGIPSIVLEELDAFKREGTDRGRNSREAIRLLDHLRELGSLQEGVALDNGSIVKVLFLKEKNIDTSAIPFSLHVEDNVILFLALMLKHEGYHVCFISKDLNARVKADALGLEVQDYHKEHVSEQEFYHGWKKEAIPAGELKGDYPAILEELAPHMEPNEFVLLESKNNPFNYRIFRFVAKDIFKAVQMPNLRWSLKPRNPQQMMAMDLLLDDTIKFVCLFGPAGTGKTFLALLAGLHKVLVEDEYEKMLVSRPVTPLGRDIGFLPGTIEEKLHSWMLPIYDNMQFIVHAAHVEQHMSTLEESETRYNKFRKKKEMKKKERMTSLDDLLHSGKVSLEAITYMRGRSIPYQFILIDEAQNLTPHEVKTLVTRVGEGSKVILAGDPYQIDVPYLDFASNGLVVASERFKGQKIFGSVFLEIGERSELSEMASKLL
ncbi:MAG TPA: PhoH family protein [Candidatus Bathyarchaeia archaeon]|nr:PhoH family protein [Candidatus Bathyarchaeia archaeon]